MKKGRGIAEHTVPRWLQHSAMLTTREPQGRKGEAGRAQFVGRLVRHRTISRAKTGPGPFGVRSLIWSLPWSLDVPGQLPRHIRLMGQRSPQRRACGLGRTTRVADVDA